MCVSGCLECIMWLCICVGVHNSCYSIHCKCTLCEWVFESTWLSSVRSCFCLIIEILFLMFIIRTFIFGTQYPQFLCVCVSVCVQDRKCESRGGQTAVHRGAGHFDHRELDSHLHGSGETAAAQQKHRAPQSQQRGTTTLLRLAAESLQVHILLLMLAVTFSSLWKTRGGMWALCESGYKAVKSYDLRYIFHNYATFCFLD